MPVPTSVPTRPLSRLPLLSAMVREPDHSFMFHRATWWVHTVAGGRTAVTGRLQAALAVGAAPTNIDTAAIATVNERRLFTDSPSFETDLIMLSSIVQGKRHI